ncbi:hypothetical protein GQ53DRAFT_879862 [Thozetella sp. PMI_491]|nr:hypothetical protein GQ53DRAFT_879862 [Thozetella sp. PMI_491]
MDEKAQAGAVAAEPIPLKCILCPRKPGFSDVSHLLTHIASKTHLSHRFKTEVQADSDATARETLGRYEEWYERYGIRTLLASRMAAKDQKKPTGKRGRPAGAANLTRSRQTKSRIQVPVNRDVEDLKAEPEDPRQEYGIIHPGYHAALLKNNNEYSASASPDNLVRVKYERWPSASDTVTTESAPASENATECGDEGNDTSKLKGVRWPGMGLFDSANEDQKRKRNQRKDESVLKHMEETSYSVEPTEFVWTGEGGLQLQRTRDIYDSPSVEGSPDRQFEEEDKANTKKKARRSSATTSSAQPRQTRQTRPTRSSARIARIKQSSKSKDINSNPAIDDEDSEHMKPAARSHVRGDASIHGPVDSYDVFRDALERDPTGNLLEDSSFELRRPALQPLSSNISINSPTPKSLAHSHNYDISLRGPEKSPFSTHVSGHATQPYFQTQASISSGSVNPLYIRTGSGFTSFAPFSYQTYGVDTKASTPTFPQASNGTSGLGSSLSYNPYTNSYTDHTTNRAHDFDI